MGGGDTYPRIHPGKSLEVGMSKANYKFLIPHHFVLIKQSGAGCKLFLNSLSLVKKN
jgi:hypothetical protein